MTRVPRPSRRSLTLGLGATGLAAMLPWAAAPASAAPARGRWRRRAADTYAAMQRHTYLPEQRLHLEEKGEAGDPYAFVWTARETAAATVDLDRLPPAGTRYGTDLEARFDALEHYWDDESGSYASYPVPPLGAGGDSYFDDNAVIGLEQIRRYRITQDPDALAAAERIFEFLPRAWDPAGGMHWVDADWNPHRGATNVTSLTSELAAHLYELTGHEHYLEWAHRTWSWVHETMRREPGLDANSIDTDGSVNETLWTYNSGAMIGAAVLLHRATGEASYLEAAREDLRGALDHWGAQETLYAQPVIFNAILFANLLLSTTVVPETLSEIEGVMEPYAQRLWDENRDAESGLFSFQAGGGGAPDPSATAQTLHQAGAIQVFALLGWRPKDYPLAT
ncbi:glycoside hydrolase family 76 protein [Brachybacterium sp. GCM10030267]|uniref:glycoside hydrolase family 76 protein n=1 Tax=unclassified Brachybacterium TaxID=2623841 RepID=UPI00362308F5